MGRGEHGGLLIGLVAGGCEYDQVLVGFIDGFVDRFAEFGDYRQVRLEAPGADDDVTGCCAVG